MGKLSEALEYAEKLRTRKLCIDDGKHVWLKSIDVESEDFWNITVVATCSRCGAKFRGAGVWKM